MRSEPTPVPPISVSPSPPLPECSQSSAVAAPLDSIPKGINRSPSLSASQALVSLGSAAGYALVFAPCTEPTVP